MHARRGRRFFGVGARLAALVVASLAATSGGPQSGVAADGDLGETRQVALQRAAESDAAREPNGARGAAAKDAAKKDGPAKGTGKKEAPKKPTAKEAGKQDAASDDARNAESKGAAKGARKGGPKSAPKPTDAARSASDALDKETRVRPFVAEHHAELAQLLDHLKEHNPSEYERALRDLDRAVERVESWRGRDASRHALELRQWQNQSRIDLLAARLKMANSEDYREPLRALLRERLEIKFELLSLERERLAERLAKTDLQLQQLAADREAAVENQLKVFLSANKPAKGGPAKETKSKSSK